MSGFEAILIFFGGLVAGFINSMAGGGSLLTVPLLSLGGVEGLLANGTNRVAVLIQNGSSGYGYAKRDVVAFRRALPIFAPAVVGGLVGAVAVSGIDDALFEKLFGFLMFPMLGLAIWRPKAVVATKPWPLWLTIVVFFLLGVYAGAIQAGVGLILLLVLSRAGFDLVEGNAIKTYVILVVSAVAVVTFLVKGQVRWVPAIVLSAGMAIGGYVGSQFAVSGGEKVIRPVLVISVVALALKMIGLY
jgi:uncharacterized membrane protein YfcA